MTHEEYKQQLTAWAGLTEKRLAALCDEYPTKAASNHGTKSCPHAGSDEAPRYPSDDGTENAADAAASSAGLGFRVRRGCLVDFLIAGGRHGSGKPERIHAEVSRLCPRLLPHVEYSVSHAFPSYEAYRPSPAETPDASRL